jgi:hypothetical protein
MISKTLSTSEKRAALHEVVPNLAEFCQQLYPLLVAHADDFGRLQGDPFTVKHAIDPTSPRSIQDFEIGLKSLNDVGLLIWYQVGDRRFIQIQNFDPHQSGLHKRSSSAFPEPPGNSGNIAEFPSEGKGTEQKRTQQNLVISPEPHGDSGQVAAKTFLEFPVVGRGGPTWCLTEALVSEFEQLYPTVNVRQESRAALGWVRSNQGRRKTVSGMRKFLNGWMTKATNGGRGSHKDDAQPAVPWSCPHVDRCSHRAMCESKTVIGPEKYPVRAAS